MARGVKKERKRAEMPYSAVGENVREDRGGGGTNERLSAAMAFSIAVSERR